MTIKYDVGTLVYVPFKVYSVNITDKGIIYQIRGTDEHKHITLTVTEEYMDEYATYPEGREERE